VIIEWLHRGKPTVLGAATGAVAGLVAITPAAGYVASLSSILFGLAAGIVCYFAVQLKDRLGYDDSLDVVGIHGVGGIVGGLLLGLLSSLDVNKSGADGGLDLLFSQTIAMGSVIVFSAVMTFAIAKLIDAVIGLRVSDEHEFTGLDISIHGETVYSEERTINLDAPHGATQL
jgi:Amt family ammonium transporter